MISQPRCSNVLNLDAYFCVLADDIKHRQEILAKQHQNTSISALVIHYWYDENHLYPCFLHSLTTQGSVISQALSTDGSNLIWKSLIDFYAKSG